MDASHIDGEDALATRESVPNARASRRIDTIRNHVKPTMIPCRSVVSTLSGAYHGLFGSLPNTAAHGGELVARVLKAHGVKWVFTLSGGHISPILVAATNTDGIRVVARHDDLHREPIDRTPWILIPAYCFANSFVARTCATR